ncbi:MAG: IS110 family transposase, partial [Alphaproteobacteria bacterium]|nr:IS110 family transposase [Alphaproteobacteria bacterium]
MEARYTQQGAIHVDLAAIFVSLELSKSKWLITSLSPGGCDRMLTNSVNGGDVPALLSLFSS